VHDTCCALRGRPVAASLAKHWPDAVWECSHIGGDRFAPNVVVLPDGFYYGNLDPDSAIDVVGQHLAGTVPSTHLRGMARYSPPVQAAVAASYERCAPLGPRDVIVRKVDRDGPHDGHGSQTTVELDIAGRPDPLRVEVLSVRRPAAQLTCRASRATPATEYRVQSFG
jgi:(2Fe-2S) ferredoxin